MIAVDTNILVYAHRKDAPFHSPASTCLVTLAEGRQSWTIPWPCIYEFIGIVTHSKIFKPPSTLLEAVKQIESWLESPTLSLLTEGGSSWDVLKATLLSGKIVGPKIHDAKIFAVCKQNEVRTLWSCDRDFSRFSGIKIENPLFK